MSFRIGIGYDVHRLAEDRELIIGGIKIPFDKGLLGHSDADVLTHAVMDALLGAAGKSDIGKHFPDTDCKYKGISSIILLNEVGKLLRQENYSIVNIDAVIIAQKPRLAAYIDGMRDCIASCLSISMVDVNIKATTEEGLGFTGSGEGMAAQAVCMINKGIEGKE